MNPFLQKTDGTFEINYFEFVFSQVEKLVINKPVVVSVGGKSVHDFRINLQKAKTKLGFEVKSKVDKTGDLWLVRTA